MLGNKYTANYNNEADDFLLSFFRPPLVTSRLFLSPWCGYGPVYAAMPAFSLILHHVEA